MKKFFALLLSSLLLCACLGLAACEKPCGTAFTVTVENQEGTVLCERTACPGELVTVEAAREGYTLRALYIDGKRTAGEGFVMPARDVSVVAVLDNMSETAHTVSVSESGECGRTVADYTAAEAGERVTLTTYVAYGCSLRGYLVNGEELDGNTFTMPDADVVVTVLYNELPETDVALTVSQSYQNATSRWYAGYSETGFTVDAVVEDNILFTDTEYLNSFAYADNIEFIVGKRTTATGWDGRFKIIVDAAGNSEIRRYENGWVLASVSMNVTLRRCTLENSGFNGYRATVFLPYSIFGLSYETALGNLAIAPAMRNTLNGLKTAWGSFTGMHCNWIDSKTHLIVLPDGTFSMGDFSVKALFAGGGLFSLARWGNFYTDVGALGDVWSVAESGRDTAYWLENFATLKESAPQTVFFTAELGDRSPLAAFSEFMSFAEEFARQLPAARLIAVSPVPVLSSADPGAAAAFAAMLEDYVSEHKEIGFVDLCSAVCPKEPNRNLYASATSLSEDGYALLGKLIREEENVYESVGGTAWGDSGAYVASGNWRESGSTLTLDSDGTRKIYYRTPLSGDFTFTVQLLARTIYNGDAFPKFGFTVQNGNVAHAFYISGEDGLTATRGGFVPYMMGIFDWNNSAETAVPGLAYTGTQFATLRLEREGNMLAFYINDTCVYAGDLGYGRSEMVVGLFSFNTALTLRNWQCTEEEAV